MNIIQDLATKYSEEVAAFMDLQMKAFCDKNLIPYNNMTFTYKWLRDRGLRLLDEVEGEPLGDKKHTLVLARVLDEHTYIVKAPKINLEETK